MNSVPAHSFSSGRDSTPRSSGIRDCRGRVAVLKRRARRLSGLVRVSPVPLLLCLGFLVSPASGGTASSNLDLFKAGKYLELRQYDKALAYYMVRLRSAPDNGALNNTVGFVLLMKGNCSNALRYFSKALKVEPTNHAFWNNLGVCRFRLKELAGSEEAYARSLKYSPGNPKVLYNLAVVCFYRRKYWQSVGFLLAAYRKDKRYVEARFERKKFLGEVREMRKLYPEDRDLVDIERRLLENEAKNRK